MSGTRRSVSAPHALYLCGVGKLNLLAALSTADSDGKRSAHELCSRHSPECDSVSGGHHPGEAVIQHGRVLGSLAVTRGECGDVAGVKLLVKRVPSTAIGDFAFKLPAAYSSQLFRFLSTDFGTQTLRSSIIERIQSPPYVTADPFVRFVDLETVWDQSPVLMLFTDGVDKLLNKSRYYFNPLSKPAVIIEPSNAVAVLLQDEIDDTVEGLLGYQVKPRWSGTLRNKALDVLGNLIGGTNKRILQLVMDQDLLADRTACPSLHIDDTSIIICSFANSSLTTPRTS